MEVDLGPGHTVLDGAQLPLRNGHNSPASLRPMSIVAKRSPISDTTELLLYNRKINMNFEVLRVVCVCAQKIGSV